MMSSGDWIAAGVGAAVVLGPTIRWCIDRWTKDERATANEVKTRAITDERHALMLGAIENRLNVTDARVTKLDETVDKLYREAVRAETLNTVQHASVVEALAELKARMEKRG